MNVKIKSYLGISLDHSASMRGLTKNAMQDYNTNIQGIRDSAYEHQQDVIVSVVNCGHGQTDKVSREIVNSSITALTPLTSYQADGRGTPLFDSVGELISIFESVPDYNDPNVSFILTIITDGAENSSKNWSANALKQKIRDLQATDKWTFTFRVPRGYGQNLIRDLGLHDGNVQEWDLSSKGLEQSSVQTKAAFSNYFTARSTGVRSTSTFYASMKDVKIEDVKAVLTDISSEVQTWTVQTASEGFMIRDFVEHKLGGPMKKGGAFYQLVKVEAEIQPSKLIIIRDKSTGVVYAGDAARDMLGLPRNNKARVRPTDLGNYDVFIQSTSVNRKLPVGTQVLYWDKVGTDFKH